MTFYLRYALCEGVDIYVFCYQDGPARTTSIIITSSALTFILLAATLVTFTFLMSPVIEKMFGQSISSLSNLQSQD